MFNAVVKINSIAYARIVWTTLIVYNIIKLINLFMYTSQPPLAVPNVTNHLSTTSSLQLHIHNVRFMAQLK